MTASTRGRKPITPDNPSDLDKALAKWITDEKGVKISARLVRAVLMYRNEFSQTPERLAVKFARSEEAAARKEARAERLRAQLAQLEGDEEAPRRRGRPRKVTVEPEEEPDEDETGDEHVDPEVEVDPETEEAPKPVARRRRTKPKTAGRKVSF